MISPVGVSAGRVGVWCPGSPEQVIGKSQHIADIDSTVIVDVPLLRAMAMGAKYETGPADNLTGKNVKIKIDLPTSSDSLSILGVIVWSQEVYLEGKTTAVVGIQFKEMTDTDRRLLESYHYGSEGEQNLIWSLWDSLMEK